MERKLLAQLTARFGVRSRDVALLPGPVARVGVLHFRLDDAGTLRVWAGEHGGWAVARTLWELGEALIGTSGLTPPPR